MATQTITTHRHTCDLCGQEQQDRELARLYGPPAFPAKTGDRVDICKGCQARPVGDVLALLAKTMKTVRVQIIGPADRQRSPEEAARLQERPAGPREHLTRVKDEREQTA